MKRVFVPVAATLVLAMVMGCAPGPNRLVDSPDEDGKVAGFWKGLWHGIIAPVTFIVSLFTNKVHLYEVHNSGNWYNLGFLLGMVIILGCGSGGACKRSRRC
jgi:hypothetical protein